MTTSRQKEQEATHQTQYPKALAEPRLYATLLVCLFELWSCALFWAFSRDPTKLLAEQNGSF